MARKSYSDKEREQVKEALMITVLQCIVNRGLVRSSIDTREKAERKWNRQAAAPPAKEENSTLHRIGQRRLCHHPHHRQGQHGGMLCRSAGLSV